MIVFNKIHIVAFKGIFDCTINFDDLGNNLYSLEGINHTVDFASSNGAGKSTIFDALLFCLYGLTNDTSLKKVDYQNKNTNIKMCVDLDLTIQNVKYKIQRTEKEFKLFNEDGESISELNNSDTEKKFWNILNLTKSEFCNFTYLSQNNSSSFLNKTPTEKLNIIKDFIYGDEIVNFEQKLKSCYNEINNNKNNVDLEIAELSGKLYIYDSVLKQQDNTITYPYSLDHYKNEYNSLKETIQKYNSIEENLKDIKNKANKLLKVKKNYVEKYNKAKNNICPTCGQTLQDNTVIKEIINKIKEVNDSIEKIKEKNKELLLEKQKYDTDIESILERKIEVEKIIENIDKQNRVKSIINNFDQSYDELQTESVDLNDKLTKYAAQLQQVKYMQTFFKTDFISYIQQQFIKEIENYLNIYCCNIFDGDFKLTFSNNNLILTINDKPYSYYSGGEKERIDFIFVFAVKVALTHFTDKCTNLFIADESLRGQDTKAFDNCLDIINNLTQTEEITTILISHRDIDYESNKIIIEKFDRYNKIDIVKI